MVDKINRIIGLRDNYHNYWLMKGIRDPAVSPCRSESGKKFGQNIFSRLTMCRKYLMLSNSYNIFPVKKYFDQFFLCPSIVVSSG